MTFKDFLLNDGNLHEASVYDSKLFKLCEKLRLKFEKELMNSQTIKDLANDPKLHLSEIIGSDIIGKDVDIKDTSHPMIHQPLLKIPVVGVFYSKNKKYLEDTLFKKLVYDMDYLKKILNKVFFSNKEFMETFGYKEKRWSVGASQESLEKDGKDWVCEYEFRITFDTPHKN